MSYHLHYFKIPWFPEHCLIIQMNIMSNKFFLILASNLPM